VQGGVPPAEIAVVTPYRVQVRAIRDALARLPASGALTAVFDAVTVDTVERIQGQERDVVFLSFVKDADAPDDAATRVFTPERLNVALTRARCKRVLVGDPRVIEQVLSTGGIRT
jgi:superfamily I DNA and/or RNA helicase